MLTGWRYRIVSVLGVSGITIGSVFLTNLPGVQEILTTAVPFISRLEPVILTGSEFRWALFISILIVLASFVQLFRPEPHRTLDVVFAVERRVIFAVCAIATLGYFEWSSRLPRQTVIFMAVILAVTLPLFFVVITQSPTRETDRSIVVGDDLKGIEQITETFDGPLLGYVAPPTPYQTDETNRLQQATDGGVVDFNHGYIGGLSRLEETLRAYNINTVVLAFETTDRAEFFGAIHACYEHGVNVKTHVDHTESLLIDTASAEGPLVDVDIEPWDIQDRLFKRLFDLAFAGSALFVLSPVIIVIAAAIKLEGHGPILFSQARTYRFGDTFTVYKFRTLKPEPDGEVGTAFADDRRTPLGDFLRMTHLDEIPQLWSILIGDMSVVGPRPAQTDLEDEFEEQAATWKRRWFVKPGLTGLAQINDATSQEPALKIDYDIEYIRRQSLLFDVKIVLRQLWQVARDVFALGNGDHSK